MWASSDSCTNACAGKDSDGWSYLDFSRDGTTFSQEAKGRDVDGKIRQTLRWGLDSPGGKGRKKGFSESYLSTTLLAEQSAVTTVLTRGLDQDPDESGKRRLTEALQALAEDPVFRQILAATQQRVDAAYTSSGQKSRRRGSPWMELRTQRQAADKRRLEIRSQVSDSEGARGHVDERRDALNDAQTHLDQAKTLRTQLETAWQQQQTRDAVQAKVVEAMAERDRIQGLHDQLADVTTALDRERARRLPNARCRPPRKSGRRHRQLFRLPASACQQWNGATPSKHERSESKR